VPKSGQSREKARGLRSVVGKSDDRRGWSDSLFAAISIIFSAGQSAMSSAEEIRKNISFGPVNRSTVGLLKIIHLECLPVHYSASIYDAIKGGDVAHGHLAYLYGDVAVGEVCFRCEESDGVKKVYLMTIGVLPTYRQFGIGRMLIDFAIQEAKKLHPVTEVFLHVSVENAEGMAFYEHLGFDQTEMVESYYKSLDNGNAYLYTKAIQ
jgi:GNAT superfamily N-acetyltransferase